MQFVYLRCRAVREKAFLAPCRSYFSLCLDRTVAGVQLRPASSFTSTALWPSSHYTLTSAHSAHKVRHVAKHAGLGFFSYSSALVPFPHSPLFLCTAPGGFKLRVSGVPSSSLLPLHADILASLFSPEGQPYLLEVTHLKH